MPEMRKQNVSGCRILSEVRREEGRGVIVHSLFCGIDGRGGFLFQMRKTSINVLSVMPCGTAPGRFILPEVRS